MEVERKLLLPDRHAWSALAQHLRGAQSLHQHNRFLDDAARTWQTTGLALRVREVDDCTWLTVKGPGVQDGDFVRRAEWEQEIPRHHRDLLLAGDATSTAWVVQWLSGRGAEAPAGSGAPLREIAAFSNLRHLGWWEHDGRPWEIALDRSRYPDGSVVYELELELRDQAAAPASAALDALLTAAGVDATPSTVSKRHRLAEALGEDDGSRP